MINAGSQTQSTIPAPPAGTPPELKTEDPPELNVTPVAPTPGATVTPPVTTPAQPTTPTPTPITPPAPSTEQPSQPVVTQPPASQPAAAPVSPVTPVVEPASPATTPITAPATPAETDENEEKPTVPAPATPATPAPAPTTETTPVSPSIEPTLTSTQAPPNANKPPRSSTAPAPMHDPKIKTPDLMKAEKLLTAHRLHPNAHHHLHTVAHHAPIPGQAHSQIVKHFNEIAAEEKEVLSGKMSEETKSHIKATTADQLTSQISQPDTIQTKEDKKATKKKSKRKPGTISKIVASAAILLLLIGGGITVFNLSGSNQDLRQQAAPIDGLQCLASDGSSNYININPSAPKAGDEVIVTCDVSGVDTADIAVRVTSPSGQSVVTSPSPDNSQHTFIADVPGPYSICCNDYCLPVAGCNQSCQGDEQCQETNPNFVCHATGNGNKCRHKDYPSQSSCNPVPTVTPTPEPTAPPEQVACGQVCNTQVNNCANGLTCDGSSILLDNLVPSDLYGTPVGICVLPSQLYESACTDAIYSETGDLSACCTVPAPTACNDDCQTDAQCQAINQYYSCLQVGSGKKCRTAANPQDTQCSTPTALPTTAEPEPPG